MHLWLLSGGVSSHETKSATLRHVTAVFCRARSSRLPRRQGSDSVSQVSDVLLSHGGSLNSHLCNPDSLVVNSVPRFWNARQWRGVLAKQPADAAMTKCARLYQREQGRLWNEAVYRPATLITNPAKCSKSYRSRVILPLHLNLCRNYDFFFRLSTKLTATTHFSQTK